MPTLTKPAAYPLVAHLFTFGNCKDLGEIDPRGTIHWFGDLAQPPIFNRLLDATRGGFWSIEVEGATELVPFEVEKDGVFTEPGPGIATRYLLQSNVVEHEYRTHVKRRGRVLRGILAVKTFSPMKIRKDQGPMPVLVRRLECTRGRVTVTMTIKVTPENANPAIPTPASSVPMNGKLLIPGGTLPSGEQQHIGLVVHAGNVLLHQTIFTEDWIPHQSHTTYQLRCTLTEGQPLSVSMFVGTKEEVSGLMSGAQPTDPTGKLMSDTISYWNRDMRRYPYQGPGQENVRRAVLGSALLWYAPTGAIAAAGTDNLPETIGGVRNWCYRFCWPRDGSMGAEALLAMGLIDEAESFLHWLTRLGQAELEAAQARLEAAQTEVAAAQARLEAAQAKSEAAQAELEAAQAELEAAQAELEAAQAEAKKNRVHFWKILYPLAERGDTKERILAHLSGYAGSSPVREGNAATDQTQLDTYGEVASFLYAFINARGYRHDAASLLWEIADYVCEHFRDPDQGIWEARGPGQTYTYSQACCWGALNWAVRVAENNGDRETSNGVRDLDVSRWRQARDEIEREFFDRGYNREIESFTQTYDGEALDASLLLMHRYGIVKPTDRRFKNTVRRIKKHLVNKGKFVLRYRMGEGADDGLVGEEGGFVACEYWLIEALAEAGMLKEAEKRFERMRRLIGPSGLIAEMIQADGSQLGNHPQLYSLTSLIMAAHALQRARQRAAERAERAEADQES